MTPATIPLRDEDAILGVRPRAAYAPGTVEEAAEVMAMAAGERLRLGFIGGGTALGLGAAPTALDAVIRTERLARIVEHVPADMVVIVEAGCTLAALQAALGAHGQRLALDAPSPEQATIGGIIATGAFGPLRARHGGVRDLIIGVTLIRADGEVARGGGKVVKNVAGFDLPKVVCGSLGTLGMVATAAFRLHPVPETTRTVLVPGVRAQAVVDLVAAVRSAQLEPASMIALSGADEQFDLGIAFEGFERGVAQQIARTLELAGSAAAVAGDEAARAFRRRHDAVRAATPLRLRVSGLPTRFPAIAAQLAGLGDLAWYATLGLGIAGGVPGGVIHDVPGAIASVTCARAALVAGGGSLVVEAAPPELRQALDPWGPRPPSFAIMERLKRRFDPDGRLNPGRFVGGL
ncbi:MAG TPA: FAD-binding oxidoreductase [Kofleriaceae bacterium]|nr:FAD-binding oxidoreductase [Kofleriaceae bacterium]